MKRLKSNYNNDPYTQYKYDLNWRDDGNDAPDAITHVEDPSMADFIKGYKYEPYKMRYWAKVQKADKNPKRLMRIAWKEVDVLQFSPEYLADKILKLWNQIDGTLQGTFEAFTLRYNNKLKQEIAEIINNQGYEVYPILIVDAPMYDGYDSYSNYINEPNNRLNKISKNNKVNRIIAFLNSNIKTIASNHLKEDLLYVKNHRINDDKITDNIINYYIQLFPQDYTLNLLKNHKSDNYFKEFKDIQISDEALSQIEKWDSGTDDSINLKDNPYNAYDFNTDMRYDTTAPNQYEVSNGTNSVYRLGKKKVKADDEEPTPPSPEDAAMAFDNMDDLDSMPGDIDFDESDYNDQDVSTVELEEDANGEVQEVEKDTKEPYDENNKIPFELALDCLNYATKDICRKLNCKLLKPPVPISIYIRKDNFVEPDNYSFESQVAVIDYLDVVFMVYEYFLSDRTHVFAIIQADRYTSDYIHYEWDNHRYRGFYSTKQEAINYIKGKLR